MQASTTQQTKIYTPTAHDALDIYHTRHLLWRRIDQLQTADLWTPSWHTVSSLLSVAVSNCVHSASLRAQTESRSHRE
jgi:hypothetical protein